MASGWGRRRAGRILTSPSWKLTRTSESAIRVCCLWSRPLNSEQAFITASLACLAFPSSLRNVSNEPSGPLVALWCPFAPLAGRDVEGGRPHQSHTATGKAELGSHKVRGAGKEEAKAGNAKEDRGVSGRKGSSPPVQDFLKVLVVQHPAFDIRLCRHGRGARRLVKERELPEGCRASQGQKSSAGGGGD